MIKSLTRRLARLAQIRAKKDGQLQMVRAADVACFPSTFHGWALPDGAFVARGREAIPALVALIGHGKPIEERRGVIEALRALREQESRGA